MEAIQMRLNGKKITYEEYIAHMELMRDLGYKFKKPLPYVPGIIRLEFFKAHDNIIDRIDYYISEYENILLPQLLC